MYLAIEMNHRLPIPFSVCGEQCLLTLGALKGQNARAQGKRSVALGIG